MKLGTIGRIGGVLALTMGLAGCFDMTTDIEVTSPTTAKATVTEVMGADIYSMIKSGQGSQDDKFCGKEGEKLTENADGTATCVFNSEGAFADLKFGDSGTAPTFTPQADGSIKVAVVTKGMTGDLGKESFKLMPPINGVEPEMDCRRDCAPRTEDAWRRGLWRIHRMVQVGDVNSDVPRAGSAHAWHYMFKQPRREYMLVEYRLSEKYINEFFH